MIQIMVEKITDSVLMQEACSFTINAKSNMSLAKIYKCEHSPMRTQMFVIKMFNIPTFVSVHLVRHKHGVEHYISSNRDDRIKNYTEEYGSSDTYKGFTSEYFKNVFTYKDGKLFWKESRSRNKIKVGDEAGCLTSHGRWQINMEGKSLFRSIIIFMINKGYKPPTVDHEDRNKLNDYIENLRPATSKENSYNTNYKNKTGYKGVHIRENITKENTYYAIIETEGLSKNLGTYATPEEAAIAYDSEAVKLFGRFAKLNFPNKQLIDRNTPLNHMMLINAQALINMARKRLCYKAHEQTIYIMNEIKKEVAKVDSDLAGFMVKDCVYRNGCNELKPCGFYSKICTAKTNDMWDTFE